MRLETINKIILPAILLFLIFSILLNVFLSSQLRKYYTMLYAIELDPLGLAYFQEGTNPQKPDKNLQTVVFFGDSRAAQWPDPELDGFWFANRGIGNQTSSQIANRFDEHIRPLQPDVVVLQLCINDLKTIPLFPERKVEIILNCESNIQKIVQASRELDSVVVVSTVFPAGKIPLVRRLVWSDDIKQSVREVNQFIHGLSDDRIVIFDAAEILSDGNGRIKQEYSFDALHLTEAGYKALNAELAKLLENLNQD